jgi:pimeloyl-ACP methyl ester carboxylesterase
LFRTAEQPGQAGTIAPAVESAGQASGPDQEVIVRRFRLLALLTLVLAVAVPGAGSASSAVYRVPAQWTVQDWDGSELTIKGGLFWAEEDFGCYDSVVLLVHGLSYGEYAWDFPHEPDTYSVARSLARAGFPAMVIDLPGYGASTTPKQSAGSTLGGYSLTVEAYAAMVGHVLDNLNNVFGDVALVGHSAGTEITELALGLGLGEADAYVPTGYTHFPSQRIAQDFFTGDYIRAATADYEYFGGTEQGRTEYMYAPAGSPLVDPAVVAADHARAVLTPSGEVYSIGPQPSKLVMGNITQPTLLVLAEKDLLFPVELAGADLASLELGLFTGASEKALHVVPGAGHSFMLHKNAPDTMSAINGFLGRHLSGC